MNGKEVVALKALKGVTPKLQESKSNNKMVQFVSKQALRARYLAVKALNLSVKATIMLIKTVSKLVRYIIALLSPIISIMLIMIIIAGGALGLVIMAADNEQTMSLSQIKKSNNSRGSSGGSAGEFTACADTKKIIKMSDKECWQLLSGGKFSSYMECKNISKAACKKYFKVENIKVKVWKFKDRNDPDKGKKSATVDICVNKALTQYFTDFFNDLYNCPEQWVIESVGGYCVRTKNNGSGASNLSGHSFGGTVDINPTLYGMGSVAAGDGHSNYGWCSGIACGHHYSTLEGEKEPMKSGCCASDSSWAEVAKKYRLDWGGNWSERYQDSMHFSLVGDQNKDTRGFTAKTKGQSAKHRAH